MRCYFWADTVGSHHQSRKAAPSRHRRLPNVSDVFVKDIFNRAQRDFRFDFSPPRATKENDVWKPLLVCVCTCVSIWGSNKGVLIFKQLYPPTLPNCRARPCTIWWFYADMRQVLDCMDHGELTLAVLETERWIPGVWPMRFGVIYEKKKDDIFLPLQTVEVPITLTRYMHTDVLNRALCAPSLKFKVVAHQWSLDETLLRWILQVSARQNLVVIFILFHN